MLHIPAELRTRIASQSLFKALAKEAVESLIQQGRIFTYSPDESIIEENCKNLHLFLILKGSANALINGTPVGIVEAGEFAGEISMAGISPPVASVVAKTEVEAAAFPWSAIRQLAKSDKQFANRLRESGFHRISK